MSDQPHSLWYPDDAIDALQVGVEAGWVPCTNPAHPTHKRVAVTVIGTIVHNHRAASGVVLLDPVLARYLLDRLVEDEDVAAATYGDINLSEVVPVEDEHGHVHFPRSAGPLVEGPVPDIEEDP